MRPLTDHAIQVRAVLADPARLVEALHLTDRSRRQPGGVMVLCPTGHERNPSCSVTRGQDGTVRFKCFSCQWAADALGAIAVVYGLDQRSNFQEILAIGAELGGNLGLADEIRGATERRERKPIPKPKPMIARPYPAADEVLDLWTRCGSVADEKRASGALVARKLDPVVVAELDLARVIPEGLGELPDWASYRGTGAVRRPWTETGHRMLVRAWDHEGRFRSVRAWRIEDSDLPKRLPPAGMRATGLVQANRCAWMMLAGGYCPSRLVICEGEPDWMVGSVAVWPKDAVVGIASGSWTADFAKRVPSGTYVVVATHPDKAGDKYADEILETIGDRCPAWRWRPTG